MSDELKPCPFCDGAAERMWRYTLPGEGPVRYWVMCPACGASTKAFDTEEEADSAWNARVERTCRFTLEEDREEVAEREKCGPAEFVVQSMPELAWTCSNCGKQYRNGCGGLPSWLRHCPECGAKVAPC